MTGQIVKNPCYSYTFENILLSNPQQEFNGVYARARRLISNNLTMDHMSFNVKFMHWII